MIPVLLIASTHLYAQTAYDEVAKKIQGRWYFGEERGCTDSRTSDEGVIYSINSKGKIVSETKNKDLVTTGSGLFTDIEYFNKEKNEFLFLSEGKDFGSGKTISKKTTLQFDPDFNTMTIINQEVDGIETIRNNIKLSTNTAEGIGGYKCVKNVQKQSNVFSSSSLNNKSETIKQVDSDFDKAKIARQKRISDYEDYLKANTPNFGQSPYALFNYCMSKYSDPKIPDRTSKHSACMSMGIDAFFQSPEYEGELKLQVEKLKATRAGAEIAKTNLNNCLNSEKIAVCSISTMAPVYKCGQVWERGYNWEGRYEWHDKFCNDNANVMVTFISKNNLSSQVKDIVFKCESIAKSGTVIGSKEIQVFDSWTPGSSKEVSITIPRINQTDSLKCFAKSWK